MLNRDSEMTIKSVLTLIIVANETSSPYNELLLSWKKLRGSSVCTYFPSEVEVPEYLKMFSSNGNFWGFVKALRNAVKNRDIQVVHIHSPQLAVIFLLCMPFLAPRLLRKSVYTVHSSFSNYRFRNRLMLLVTFLFIRQVVFCSDSSRNSFPGYFLRVLGQRANTVSNGVDVDKVRRAPDGGRWATRPDSERELTVVAIGRLVNVKQPDVILGAYIEAVRSLPDVRSRLVFVGDGPLKNSLQQQVVSESGHGIVFKGLVPRLEVYRLLQEADVFVSSSKVEGMPVAAMEAMAYQCPVILSDIPSHRELAQRASGKLKLINSSAVGEFAKSISEHLAMSSAEREEIGKHCRKVIQRNFSMESMHAGYSNVYLKVAYSRSA
jgi:glycosyltransferase involved in cell wall biosynthesis